MSQALRLVPTGKLPGLPTGPLSPQQQMEALRRVQAQAEQRVALGLQLFKAAEAYATKHQDMIQQLRQEQDGLRQQMETDVARSLRRYDDWIGKVDRDLAQAVVGIEQKIQQVQTQWGQIQKRVEHLVSRAEQMLDQSRCLMERLADQVEQQETDQAGTPPAAIPSMDAATAEEAPLSIAAHELESGQDNQYELATQPDSPSDSDRPDAPSASEEPSVIYTQLVDRMRKRLEREQM